MLFDKAKPLFFPIKSIPSHINTDTDDKASRVRHHFLRNKSPTLRPSKALNHQLEPLKRRRCLTADCLLIDTPESKPSKTVVKKEMRDKDNRDSSPLLKIYQSNRLTKRLPLHNKKILSPPLDKINNKTLTGSNSLSIHSEN